MVRIGHLKEQTVAQRPERHEGGPQRHIHRHCGSNRGNDTNTERLLYATVPSRGPGRIGAMAGESVVQEVHHPLPHSLRSSNMAPKEIMHTASKMAWQN